MKKRYFFLNEQITIGLYLLRLALIVTPVAVLIGFIVAFFLWLLDIATQVRWTHHWLMYFLPLAGVLIALLYKCLGKGTEGGNNIIIEEINNCDKGVRLRMTPLIIITTVITHLFGGSAGREGTAVQIGGSIASYVSRIMKLSKSENQILLMAGIAAGFGAVFGTPIAGTIFAIEVLFVGRIKYNALLPCLFAAITADIVCSSCGIGHIHYEVNYQNQKNIFLSFNFRLLLKVVFSAIIYGLVTLLFIKITDIIKEISNQYIRHKLLIPVFGGILVLLICYFLNTTDYIGLGVNNPTNGGISIVSSFNDGGAETFSWFWKLLLTAITLSMGFKGGEVTPLFFIGATLGNTLAMISGGPVDLFAALGFIAVFSAATNTPIASTILGVELFGGEYLIYYAVSCVVAYYFSGNKGIYHSQRVEVYKGLKNESVNHNEEDKHRSF